MATMVHQREQRNGRSRFTARRKHARHRRKPSAVLKVRNHDIAPEDIALFNAVSRAAAKSLSR